MPAKKRPTSQQPRARHPGARLADTQSAGAQSAGTQATGTPLAGTLDVVDGGDAEALLHEQLSGQVRELAALYGQAPPANLMERFIAFERYLGSTPDAILIFDEELTCRSAAGGLLSAFCLARPTGRTAAEILCGGLVEAASTIRLVLADGESRLRTLEDAGRFYSAAFVAVREDGGDHSASRVAVHLRDVGELAGMLASDAERLRKVAMLKTRALAEAETRIADIIEKAPWGYYRVDAKGRFLAINPAFARILGYEHPDEVLQASRPIRSYWKHPERRADFLAVLEAEGAVTDYEVQLTDIHGRDIWVIANSRLVRDGSGGVSFVEGSVDNIDQRKAAEARLADQLAFFATLVDTLPDPVFYKDVGGRYIGCNASFERFIGKRKEDIAGKTVFDLMGSSDPQKMELARTYHEQDMDLLANPGVQRYESQVKVTDEDGAESVRDVVFHKATFTDSADRVAGLVGVVTEVTEVRKAQRELAESRARFLAIVEDQTELIWRVRSEGNEDVAGGLTVLFANPAFCRYFETDCDTVEGSRFAPPLYPADRDHLHRTMQALTEPHSAASLEVRVVVGQTPRWHQWNVRALYELGQRTGFQFVARDINEQKQAERALHQAYEMLEQRVEERTVNLREANESLHNEIQARREAESQLIAERNLFAQITQLNPSAIFKLDADGVITFANQRAGEVFGMDHRDFVGMPFTLDEKTITDVNGDPMDPAELPFPRIMRTAQSVYDFRHGIRRPGGSLLVISANGAPVFNALNEVESVVFTVEDVTERMRIERELQLSRQVFESTSEAILITDGEGRIQDVNPAFSRITGYTRSSSLGTSAFSRMADEDAAAIVEAMWQSVGAGRTWRGELWLTRKSGEAFPVRIAVSPVMEDVSNTSEEATGGEQRIRNVVAIFSDITSAKQNERQLQQLAHFDVLTGLPNRALVHDRMQQALARAKRADEMVGLMFLDLDRFKLVNDTLGHSMGDELLKEVAERLLHAVREADTVARLGGDEFFVVLPGVRSEADVSEVARRILKSLTDPVMLDEREVFISTSIGIALYPVDGEDVEVLFKNADSAMYHAKDRGRSTFKFYSEKLNTLATDRLYAEASLRHAVSRNEMVMHYQPRFDIRTGRMCGAEALMRWNHPEHGLIYPGSFIPLAEETGLIHQLGLFALQAACKQNRAWQDAGYAPFPISVNVSALQLAERTLGTTIRKVLADTGLDPRWLELELTETAIMRDVNSVAGIFDSLREVGVRICVDDFGIGYSSLNYLKRFPLDTLKIDQSFVTDLPHDSDDAAIAATIIAMAHTLGLFVVAEGVENEAQLEFLRDSDCDEFQGFLLAKPLAPDTITTMLASGKLNVRPCRTQAPKEQ